MANTPFLNLAKPAGTDRALVSVINSNSDKIDAGVSTLSDQIAKYGNKAGAIIPGGSDLDNYTTAGNYYVNNATDAGNISHMPAVIGGRLEVDEINGTSRFRQMYYANSAVPSIYTRSYTQTGWSDWEQVGFTSQFASDTAQVTTGFDTSKIVDINLVKVGTTCTARITVKSGLATGWHNDITTNIPAKYRPAVGVFGAWRINSAADISNGFIAQLSAGGLLTLCIGSTFAGNIPVSFTYPVSL